MRALLGRVLDEVEDLHPDLSTAFERFLTSAERSAASPTPVQDFLRCNVPTRDDPDYLEPPEAYCAENGVRYLQASVVSEPEGTPDVTGVTFLICGPTLVTVRYEASDSFEIFGAAPSSPTQSPSGLSTRSSIAPRALGKVGASLDAIGAAIFTAAQGDKSSRSSKVYYRTVDALGREDERISNLRESLLSLERLLLFLSAEPG